MPSREEDTYTLFGGRTAYEAKHALKEQIEGVQRGKLPVENTHEVHNKLLGEAVRKATDLQVMTAGLTERLQALGVLWGQLVQSSGGELNERIHGYIEGWAAIGRVFRNLEAERQGGGST